MPHEEDIKSRLARIETKVDLLIEDRSRLTAVERKQWYHTGGIALVAALFYKIGLPIHWGL